MIDISNLDKNKCYCNTCIKNDIITELYLNENDHEYYKPPSCNHSKNANFYRYQFIKSLNEWGAVRGLKISQKSFKE